MTDALPAGNPLAEEHYTQYADAAQRATKINRACRIAKFDAMMLGSFGVLTLICSLCSGGGWIVGVGLCAIAYVELMGFKRLCRFEAGSARRLGFNQIALGSLLFLYAAYNFVQMMWGPDPLASTLESAPEVATMVGSYSQVARMVGAAVYALLALVAIFAQGGTAWYYFSREKFLKEYRDDTPEWILKLNNRQRKAA